MTTDDIRERVRQISERARTDEDYMRQVMADPDGTLLAAGVPQGTVDEVLAEWDRGSSEVTGYLMGCGWTCLGTTCEKLSDTCGNDFTMPIRAL